MADIFLSYSRDDQDRADALATALADHGWSVFHDARVEIGANWRAALAEELGQAGCVVVLWSHSAVESVWVAEEALFAMEAGTYVPAVLDAVDPPFGFRSIEAANMQSWPGDGHEFGELVEAIGRLVPRQPGTTPEDPAPSGVTLEFLRAAMDPAELEWARAVIREANRRSPFRVEVGYDTKSRAVEVLVRLGVLEMIEDGRARWAPSYQLTRHGRWLARQIAD